MQKNVKMANFFSFFSFFHRVRPLWRYKEDLEPFLVHFDETRGCSLCLKGNRELFGSYKNIKKTALDCVSRKY